MVEPVPTTDTSPESNVPGIKKLPPWAIVGIVAAGVGIAILYKKSKEGKESFFQPTQAAQNRPYEPGFGASGAGGLGLPEEKTIGTTNAPSNSTEGLPVVSESGFPPGPQPVANTPTGTETQFPGLTPNQINALNKGFPAVTGQFAQPTSTAYPGASLAVETAFPNSQQEQIEFSKDQSYYVPPVVPGYPISEYPIIPTPAQYPVAFQTVAAAFPGGEPEHIKWVKEHSHYV